MQSVEQPHGFKNKIEDANNMAFKNSNSIFLAVDVGRSRYPYCIVWSPLPLITWFIPFIGHTGICDSEGIIFDFAGPYTIGRDSMAFGEPTRYIQLNPLQCREMEWNKGVEAGCEVYSRRMHNICCDNCHSHVAKALNLMAYGNKSNYGMIGIGVWFFFHGRFTSMSSFIKTYLPFGIILCIIILLSSLLRSN